MSRQLIDTSKAVDLITMLLPIQDKSLILPNVSVAEIINVEEVTPVKGSPKWFCGLLNWRGYGIPLISFEAINSRGGAVPERAIHAAIINGTSETGTVPFYGIITQGTPRQMRITPAEIAKSAVKKLGSAELMVTSSGGEQASIPDLGAIEGKLAKAVKKAGCAVKLAS